jgi:hypothetical protein
MTEPPPGITISANQGVTTAHLLWNAPIINENVNNTPVPQAVAQPGVGGYANPRPIDTKVELVLPKGPETATSSLMTPDGSVTISWIPRTNATPIIGYGLVFQPLPSGDSIQHSAYPFATSLTISGLDPEVTYTCEISAVNEAGWSEPTVTNLISSR